MENFGIGKEFISRVEAQVKAAGGETNSDGYINTEAEKSIFDSMFAKEKANFSEADCAEIMGFVKTETPVTEGVQQDCSPVVKEDKEDEIAYKPKGGDTWKDIVDTFYPNLVEEFGMQGEQGAIRRLKKALSYNADGTFNEQTFKALLKSADLPKTMNLPAQIDGCDRVNTTEVDYPSY